MLNRTSHCCSVAKSCLAVCNPMDWSILGFPVLHCLLELVQTYIHWVGDAIQPSHSPLTHFSSYPQSFPASGPFPMNWLFASCSQSIKTSASASVLSMVIQDWFPLALTSLILQSKGLWRVFSNTTVQRHQFFGSQPSLLSNSHICTWLLEKR